MRSSARSSFRATLGGQRLAGARGRLPRVVERAAHRRARRNRRGGGRRRGGHRGRRGRRRHLRRRHPRRARSTKTPARLSHTIPEPMWLVCGPGTVLLAEWRQVLRLEGSLNQSSSTAPPYAIALEICRLGRVSRIRPIYSCAFPSARARGFWPCSFQAALRPDVPIQPAMACPISLGESS